MNKEYILIILVVTIGIMAITTRITHAEEINLGEIEMIQVDEILPEITVPYVETWEPEVQGIAQRVLTEYMSELGVTEESQLDLDDYKTLDATVFAELGSEWEE